MHKTHMRELLQDALSPDHEKRTNAEHSIINLQSSDFLAFFGVLLEIFCEEGDPVPPYRIAAGILLKNSLHSMDPATQYQSEIRWTSLESNIRERNKKLLQRNMRSSIQRVAIISGDVLAAIARVELVRNTFKDFFMLMYSYLDEDRENLTKAVFESVGKAATYLIEETRYDFADDSSVIFNIIIRKLKKSESIVIRMEALKCLGNSLEALESTMEDHQNVKLLLNSVMTVVDEDEELTSCVVESLYMIMGLYYGKLQQSFGEIIEFMKRLSCTIAEKVTIQIIEFWCVLSEIEQEIGGDIVERNLSLIVGYLLAKLNKNEEQDEEEWNSHKAAANCIESIARCVKIDLIDFEPFRNFVVANLNSTDAKRQEIGTIALGSCIYKKIDNKDKLLEKVIPMVVRNIKKHNQKESSLWALSKICEHNFDLVEPGAVLPEMMQSASQVIQENTKSTIYAAYLISSISSYIALGRDKFWDYENHLSFFYYDFLDILIKATEAADIKDFKLRRALFTALTDFVTAASENVSVVLNEFLKYLINKSTEYLKYQTNAEQFLIIEDIISNHIILIQNIVVVRREDRIGETKDQILCLFLETLKSRPSYIYGDVYITLSVLCTPTSYFTLNISNIIPFVIRDLKSTDFYVLKAAINLVGDIANNMNQGFLVYSEYLVPELVQCLVSTNIQRDLKPVLLSVFGDVALSLGTSFMPYLDMTMHVLTQIMSLQRRFSENFVDLLRKNALQMIDCVVIALGHQEKVRANLRNIVLLVQQVISEDEDKKCVKECIGLIGDLVKIFGKVGGLGEEWVPIYIETCMVSERPEVSIIAQKTLFSWRSTN